MKRIRLQKDKATNSLPKPGDQIHIKIPALGIQFVSNVVGIDNSVAVIVHSPLHLLGSAIKDNIIHRSIIARYKKAKQEYSFTSKIYDVELRNLNYLFLEYPKSVDIYFSRVEPRFDSEIPTVMIALGVYSSDLDDLIVSNEVRLEGKIVNISMNGCCFVIKCRKNEIANNIDIMTMVALEMNYYVQDDKRHTLAIVKNIRKNNDEIHFGLEFTNKSIDFANSLKKYIHETNSLNLCDSIK